MRYSDELEREKMRWTYVNRKLADKRKYKGLNNKDKQQINKTVKWLNDDNLVITREDKKMVLMHRKEYDKFLEDYIQKTSSLSCLLIISNDSIIYLCSFFSNFLIILALS